MQTIESQPWPHPLPQPPRNRRWSRGLLSTRFREFLAQALLLLALVPTLVMTGSCSRSTNGSDGRSRKVVVSIPPLIGLIEPLVPPGWEVESLIPPGASVHDWKPTPTSSRLVAEAGLIVTVGLGLEPGIEPFIRRHARTDAAVLRFSDAVGIESEHAHDHAHDHNHDEAADPHLWLDPVLARRFVEAAAPRIRELATPDAASESQAALANLLDGLDKLDREYRQRLARFEDRAIITHHSAFTRLASRYGLRVASVLRPIETAEPTPAQIRAVAESIQAQQARVIFLEPQWSDRLADRLAETAGVRIGRLDPLGQGDYFSMMRSNLDQLTEHLAATSQDSQDQPGNDQPVEQGG